MSPCLLTRPQSLRPSLILSTLNPRRYHADIRYCYRPPPSSVLCLGIKRGRRFVRIENHFFSPEITILATITHVRTTDAPNTAWLSAIRLAVPISKEEYDRLTEIKSDRQEADSRAEYMWSGPDYDRDWVSNYNSSSKLSRGLSSARSFSRISLRLSPSVSILYFRVIPARTRVI